MLHDTTHLLQKIKWKAKKKWKKTEKKRKTLAMVYTKT